MPPGWPVFQALSMSSASAPRTSPTMMRSGRRRSVERTRSAMVTHARRACAARPCRRAAHCSSRVSSIRITRSSRRGHLGEQRIGERGLARAGAAGDQDVAALDDRERQQPRGVRRS